MVAAEPSPAATAVANDPSLLVPVVVPASVDELRFPTDLGKTLDELGFLPGWPQPKDVQTDESQPPTVIGLSIYRSWAGEPGVITVDTRIVYGGQTGELADIATEWEGRVDEVYGVGGTGLISGTVDDGEFEAAVGSAGIHEDRGAGTFSISAIRRIGDQGPAAVLVENHRDIPGDDVLLDLPETLVAALPDLSACPRMSGSIDYSAYREPGVFDEGPFYEISVEHRCADVASAAAAFEAIAAWAGPGNADPGDESVSVSERQAPDGFIVDAYAYHDDEGGWYDFTFRKPVS